MKRVFPLIPILEIWNKNFSFQWMFIHISSNTIFEFSISVFISSHIIGFSIRLPYLYLMFRIVVPEKIDMWILNNLYRKL